MRVLIIGTGNMGRAIAIRLAGGGNELTLFDIDAAKPEAIASELGGTRPGGARIAIAETPSEAVPASDVVILASSYAANLEVARMLGAELEGKIVIDISNPLNERFDDLVTDPGSSAAETIRATLPKGARFVKAFNTTFAGTLVAGQVAGQPLDVFIAGDDGDARRSVAALVRSGGLNAVDVGGLQRARQLEALGFLGIILQGHLGTGFMSGWKLLMPEQG
ncbi:MAG: reduced coenzyme oxidoreductase [Gemmatimonadetes bacterium]|jgi:predicted dinucleotide-binding enzyme|nr:reduced coenzyme oxidoreductase [Gemmatimonadota bacterium]